MGRAEAFGGGRDAAVCRQSAAVAGKGALKHRATPKRTDAAGRRMEGALGTRGGFWGRQGCNHPMTNRNRGGEGGAKAPRNAKTADAAREGALGTR